MLFAKFKVSARAMTPGLMQRPGAQIGVYRLLDTLTIRFRCTIFFKRIL